MSAWKRSPGHPPKTWLKQITADPDTTAVDLLTLTAVQVHQRSTVLPIVRRGERSQRSQGYAVVVYLNYITMAL